MTFESVQDQEACVNTFNFGYSFYDDCMHSNLYLVLV